MRVEHVLQMLADGVSDQICHFAFFVWQKGQVLPEAKLLIPEGDRLISLLAGNRSLPVAEVDRLIDVLEPDRVLSISGNSREIQVAV